MQNKHLKKYKQGKQCLLHAWDVTYVKLVSESVQVRVLGLVFCVSHWGVLSACKLHKLTPVGV